MDFSNRYNLVKHRFENYENLTLTELEDLLHESKDAQQEYHNLELIVKADANSIYGVSASIFFSLCDFDVAEDIPVTGRHFAVLVDRAINIKLTTWGEEELKIIQEFYPKVIKLRQFIEYVPDTINDACVYGDTDSRYIDNGLIYSLMETADGPMELPDDNKELADFIVFFVKRILDKLIASAINEDLIKRNGKLGHLRMCHEVTTRRCVFRAMKQYIMSPFWKDGLLFDKPKLVFKGVELKKGELNKRIKKILGILVSKFILDAYTNEMLRQECLKIIKFIKVRKELDCIYRVTAVSGLKDIYKDSSGKYCSDKKHIQMKIAISWMNFIQDNGLQGEYQFPFEGQKMNYYYDKYGKVIGVPDDVDILKVPNLPEPDWNKMLNQILLKPLLKYIYDEKEFDDNDIELFLLGVKPIILTTKI